MLVEQALVERFGWSLYEIDNTEISSLIPFFLHMAEQSGGKAAPARQQAAYCDTVSWL